MTNTKAAQVRQFYDEVWTRYLQDQEAAERHLREVFPPDLIEGGDALDGGCGGGSFAWALSRAGARSVVGLDISLGSLGTARSANAAQGLSHVCGSMEKLPFRDGQFGVVWAWGSVEHTVRPWEVLAELDRVLAPGGRIMVALYKKTWLAPLHGVIRAALSSLPRRTHAPLSKALALPLSPFVLLFRRRQKMRKGERLSGLIHDWFFVPLRHHFDPREVREWFAARGYSEELFVPSTARFESTSHFILRMRKEGSRAI